MAVQAEGPAPAVRCGARARAFGGRAARGGRGVARGLVDFGGAVWFVEAAFPTFFSDEGTTFNVVLHTGVGF
ncbi:MAG TPA: hypothetical protein VGK73_29740 [Polyangiaceae bacterium]